MNVGAGGRPFYRQVSYALGGSATALAVNAALILILPRFLSVDGYGFLHVYLLYSAYVGVLHFGIVDGMYLRYGGLQLVEFDRPRASSQLFLVVLSQAFFAIAAALGTFFLDVSVDRQFVFYGLAASILITNVRFVFVYWLQAAGDFRMASLCIVVDRLGYLFGILALAVSGSLTLSSVILVDLASKAVSGLLGAYASRVVIVLSLGTFREIIRESTLNLIAGSKLLFANLASTFSIGVFRVGIERGWEISVFARASLALGMAMMFASMVNTVGMVLFPSLRRLEKTQLPIVFGRLSGAFPFLAAFVLIGYLPMGYLITWYLPAYSESARYLGLLLPMFVAEGRMTLINNSFLKTLRAEGVLFRLNLGTLFLAALLALIFTVVFPTLEGALISIGVTLMVRSSVADAFIRRRVNYDRRSNVPLELGLAIIFWLSITLEERLGSSASFAALLINLGFLAYTAPRAARLFHLRRAGGL